MTTSRFFLLVPGRSLVAVSFMLVAVVAFSLLPLVVHIADGQESPFLFNASLRLGLAAACLVFLASLYRRALSDTAGLAVIKYHVFRWKHSNLLMWALAGSFDYALFAWSVRFIDITVSTVVFEIYPAAIIFLAAWLYRRDGRYRRITRGSVGLVLLSVLGLFLAHASQFGDFDRVASLLPLKSLLGLLLVAAAVGAVALSVCGLKWGTGLAHSLRGQFPGGFLEVYCVVIALFAVSLVSAAVNLALGLLAGEPLALRLVLVAVCGGFFANAVASIAWRVSALATRNLCIHAMGFTVPLLSLVWLIWIAQARVERLDFLLAGACAIIVANLILNLSADGRVRLFPVRRIGRNVGSGGRS